MKLITEILYVITVILVVSLMLLAIISVSGCGDDTACQNVDTSQSPDQIIRGEVTDTYVWGSCVKTYPK